MLRPFNDLAIEAEEIRSLKSLEAEVLVVKVSIIDNSRIQLIFVFHDAVVCVFANHGRKQLCLALTKGGRGEAGQIRTL